MNVYRSVILNKRREQLSTKIFFSDLVSAFKGVFLKIVKLLGKSGRATSVLFLNFPLLDLLLL